MGCKCSKAKIEFVEQTLDYLLLRVDNLLDIEGAVNKTAVLEILKECQSKIQELHK